MFPVVLTLSGRTVVVVGGGRVGLRKARAARAAGAAVRVVDPAAPPPPDGGYEWVAEPYRAAHLDGAALAFAAATPAVNAAVVADAAARGVWACDASDPGRGSFTLPAVARAGGLTVAVGTGGAAPALARRVRDKVQADLDGAYAVWVDLLRDLRPEVLSRIADPAARRALFEEFSDWPWLARVRRDGPAAVRALMLEAIARAAAGGGLDTETR